MAKCYCQYNVTDTSTSTKICGDATGFSKMWVDASAYENPLSYYSFATTGQHLVDFETVYANVHANAFVGCTTMYSISIDCQYQQIQVLDNAFNGCSSLSQIIINCPTAPYLGEGVFDGLPEVGTLSYPKGSDYTTWKEALPSGWTMYEMTSEAYVELVTPSLTVDYSGASKTIQVNYVNATTINDPISNVSWLTVSQTQSGNTTINGLPAVQVQYRLTVPATTVGRRANIVFSCIDDSGSVATDGHFLLIQSTPPDYDATITANPTSLTFPYSGGTEEVEFTVNEPDENGVDVSTTSDYITIIQQTSEVDNGDGTVTYTFLLGGDNENESTSVLTELVTVTYTNVSGQQATMEYPISFEVNPALQAEAYITLDSYAYTFPSSGGTVYVRATYGYPQTDEGISCRVVSGTVYPIAWCTATSRGGSISDDGTEGYEDWAITMTANEIGESRQCSCNFSYTNAYGESAGVTFTALQEYDEEEETPTAGITPYVSILKLDSDGLNKLQSNDYVTVAYTLIESIDEPSVNVDWFRITSSATTTTVSASTEAVKWYFQCDANTSDEARTATITFTGTDSAATYYSATVAVEQDGADGSTVQPTASISVTPKVLTFDKSGGTKTVTVTYTEAEFINSPDAIADWCTVEFAESNLPQVTYNVTVPATTVARQTNAIFKCQGYDGKTVTNEELYIMQEYDASDTPTGSTEIYIGQIWKDVEYSFGNAQIANYTIYDEDNKLLFAGRSVLRPDDETNKILINKVCQNYMESPELNFDYATVTKGYKAFTLRTEDGGTILHTYKFINDWSYDTYYTGLVSHPILDKPYIVDGQKCPFTVFAADTQVTVPYGVTYKNGSTYNNYAYVTDAMVTEMFDRVNDYPMASVHIGNKLYEAKDKCKAQYVLYYLNPWGGYDWFPIAGRVTQYDDITQYTFTKNYLNTTLQFGRSRYLSEIEKHYILNTEWLNDDESARMWYLLESNTVYLHNLKDDKIYPVIITDTRIEHKKRTIGSSRISYQIDVMLSQMRERY